MSISRFYKIISPKSPNVDINDNHGIGGGGLHGNYTWYSRLVQGSASRITRYRDYDLMDNDIDINRALDIITEEMSGNNSKNNLPLLVQLTSNTDEEKIQSAVVVTINAALKTWCKLHEWDTRLFELCRQLLKYGDAFFYRPKNKAKKWPYIHPKNVVNAVVSIDDITDVRGWHIKVDNKQADGNLGAVGGFSTIGTTYNYNVDEIKAEDVIRFTLRNDMSEDAPFGKSILSAVYKTFKQKELLEDAILIFRIVRAPARRAFYIDVGNLPAHKRAAHLEQFKNEVQQRKIPTMGGGTNQVDSVYNPQSMQEDYFLAVGQNGQGTRIETLEGGQGLGELSDLDYFYKKVWRGLRIPQSYMDTGPDGAIANDGAVGIAYMQEIKFSEYVERLQRYIEHVMDSEFKKFLYDLGLKIDTTIFKVTLPPPTNWSLSKQNKMNSELVNTYTSVVGQTEISKRFALQKYLGWTQDEILINERKLREEKGLSSDGGINDLPMLYAPESAEAGGFEGGLGNVGGMEEGEEIKDGELPEGEGNNGEESQPNTPSSSNKKNK